MGSPLALDEELMRELKGGKELGTQLLDALNLSAAVTTENHGGGDDDKVVAAAAIAEQIVASLDTSIVLLKQLVGDPAGTADFGRRPRGIHVNYSGGSTTTSGTYHHELSSSTTQEICGSPMEIIKIESTDQLSADLKVELGRKRKFSRTSTPSMVAPVGFEDGYSWRKYGQKEILNMKYPRSYFRCTHRTVQGCEARKQEQRLEDDSSHVEIIYMGNHTCKQTGASSRSDAQEGSSSADQRHGIILNFEFNSTTRSAHQLPHDPYNASTKHEDGDLGSGVASSLNDLSTLESCTSPHNEASMIWARGNQLMDHLDFKFEDAFSFDVSQNFDTTVE